MHDGIRIRYFISRIDQNYESLASLVDHKTIRARMKYLIELGFQYEKMMINGSQENNQKTGNLEELAPLKITQPKTKIKATGASHSNTAVVNKNKIPAGDEISVWN